VTTLGCYALILCAIDLWREAQNQPYSAMVGVACVCRNRVTPTKDLVAVVSAKHQFSSMTQPGDVNLVKWPESNDPVWPLCCQAVDAVFGADPIPDVTGGATFYFSPPLTEPPENEWGPVAITIKLGALTFCKQVST
jgi:spore germination cell wall hydrolase CwlJ-like protein